VYCNRQESPLFRSTWVHSLFIGSSCCLCVCVYSLFVLSVFFLSLFPGFA
jgi:hypothetical protein